MCVMFTDRGVFGAYFYSCIQLRWQIFHQRHKTGHVLRLCRYLEDGCVAI
eukprot:COSAG04_NODE_4726_length_1923_cov_1.694079_2_plen_50_part_00